MKAASASPSSHVQGMAIAKTPISSAMAAGARRPSAPVTGAVVQRRSMIARIGSPMESTVRSSLPWPVMPSRGSSKPHSAARTGVHHPWPTMPRNRTKADQPASAGPPKTSNVAHQSGCPKVNVEPSAIRPSQPALDPAIPGAACDQAAQASPRSAGAGSKEGPDNKPKRIRCRLATRAPTSMTIMPMMAGDRKRTRRRPPAKSSPVSSSIRSASSSSIKSWYWSAIRPARPSRKRLAPQPRSGSSPSGTWPEPVTPNCCAISVRCSRLRLSWAAARSCPEAIRGDLPSR